MQKQININIMETKFTKGKWTINESRDLNEHGVVKINIDAYESNLSDIITVFSFGNHDIEAEANAKLISAAPEMFYRTVLLANSEGWQDAFNLIEKVTGKKYTFNSKEFNILVEEAKSFFLA